MSTKFLKIPVYKAIFKEKTAKTERLSGFLII